jgi:hypothetical protein
MAKRKGETAAQCRRRKTRQVMGEFKKGTLKSSTGRKVVSQRQAVAIALSSARGECGGGRRRAPRARKKKKK